MAALPVAEEGARSQWIVWFLGYVVARYCKILVRQQWTECWWFCACYIYLECYVTYMFVQDRYQPSYCLGWHPHDGSCFGFLQTLPNRLYYINKISEAETKRVPNRYTSSALCNHPMQHTHVTLSRSYWRWPEMYMSRGIRRKRSQTASSGTARGIIWISYRYHHIRLSYWSILVYYHVWFRIFGWRPGSSLPMTVQAWGPDRELESHKAQTLKRTFEHMVEWCQVCARSVCIFMIIPIFYHIHMVLSSSRVWSCCWTVECRFRMI